MKYRCGCGVVRNIDGTTRSEGKLYCGHCGLERVPMREPKRKATDGKHSAR
jgi:hypothetical protein